MDFIGSAWHHSLKSLREAIPELAAQGQLAIEAGIASDGLLERADIEEIDKLLLNISAYKFRVNSIHAPFGDEVDFSSFDDTVHDRGVAALLDAIELAQLLDAKTIVVHPGHGVVKRDRMKRLDRAAGVLRELSVIAEESDVLLAVENMVPGYLCDQWPELLKLVDATRSSAVRVCFDTGHANLTPDFEDEARQLLRYAVVLHLHDNDGDIDQHLFPGQGSIDWANFAGLCRRHCSDMSALIECELPEGWDWKQSCREMSRLLAPVASN